MAKKVADTEAWTRRFRVLNFILYMYIHFQGRILASKAKKFENFSQTPKAMAVADYAAVTVLV
jgi:hypothetical protein